MARRRKRRYQGGGNIGNFASAGNKFLNSSEDDKIKLIEDDPLSGVKRGAEVGSSFGPYGTIIGGALGGTTASVKQAFFSDDEKRAEAAPARNVTDPFSTVKLGNGGRMHRLQRGGKADPLHSFVFSNKNKVAPRLDKRLNKLNLPKDFVVKFKGEKHSGPNGGIELDRTFQPVNPKHRTNVSKGSGGKVGIGVLVEDGENMINPNHLTGAFTDDITFNTARRVAEEEVVRNERMKLKTGGKARKYQDGGAMHPIDTDLFGGNLSLQDDSLFDNLGKQPSRNLLDNSNPLARIDTGRVDDQAAPGIEDLINRSSSFNQLKDVPNIPNSQLVRDRDKRNDPLGLDNLTSGDKTQLLASAVPGAFNLARGLFGKAEKVKPNLNRNNSAALNLLNQRSANLTSARNDARLAANAQVRRNANSRSAGVRNALNQQTVSNLQGSLARIGGQEQQLRNNLLSSQAQTLLQIGLDNKQAREAARQETAANKSAKVNQMTSGISQLANVGVRAGKVQNQALQNRRTFQLLQQTYPDFTLTDFEKFVGSGLSADQIIRFRSLGLVEGSEKKN